MNFTRRNISLLILPTLLSAASIHAYAFNKSPGHAYPPYHIKPGVSTLVPSGLNPSQVLNAYGISAIPHQGAGQVIGIIDAYDNPSIESDLAVFNAAYNLPACTTANKCFSKVYAQGKPQADAGWSGEIALDVEWAHAIAPQAKIMLVEARSDSFSDLMNAVKTAISNGATVVSMSWGGSEFSNETIYDSVFNSYGITFTASSGDSGYGTIYPAVSPFVISVGGTTLSTNSGGNYLDETAWDGSGGGLSRYEKQPSYQKALPIPNNPNAKRGAPDVSYNADPNTGFSVYDTMNGGWLVVGGTSAGAPQWSAIFAIANSARNAARKANLTSTATTLYNIAKANYGLNYHDITAGSNGSCGYYCTTRAGYDYVSGIGTPKAQALIQALTSA